MSKVTLHVCTRERERAWKSRLLHDHKQFFSLALPSSSLSIQVHDMTVGWAMGYLLNQTNAIPDNPHQVERPFSAVDLVVGILVLSILCFVFVVFFFLACRKVLKTRGGYSHLS